MNVRKWYLLAAVSVLGVAVFATACGSDPTPTPKPTATPVPVATATPTAAAAAATTAKPKATVAPKPKPKATVAPKPKSTFDAVKHFKGKTIRMVVGYNPGGGTDTQARFLATKFSKFIPGKPRIVVSNLTPALASRNYLWESKPNGLILSYNASSGIQQMVDPNAKFKSSEFTVIGGPVQRNAVWMASGKYPHKDIKAAMGKTSPPLIAAGSAPTPQELTGVGSLGAFMLADWLKLPFEFKLVASTGTEQTLLMMERGDVNMWIAGSVWYQLPTRRPGWLKTNYVKPFAVLAGPGGKVMDNTEGKMTAPYARDLLNDKQKDVWDGLMGAETFIGKHMTGPPKMPADLTNVLRKAWQDAVSDKKFRADFEKILGQPIEVTATGAELQKQFKQVEDAFMRNKDQLKTIQTEVYSKFIK